MADNVEPQTSAEGGRDLPTEAEIEAEANSGRGLFKYIRVARCERPLMIIVAIIFGIKCMIYAIIRIYKDSAVISKQEPASASFMKYAYVMPCTTLVLLILQKLLITHSVSEVFDYCIIISCIIYGVIGTVLLPFSDWMEPSPFWIRDIYADGKMAGKGLMFFYPPLLTMNHWISTIIYICAEVYGSVFVQFIVLAYSNHILTSLQNSRAVPIYYLFSNVALILSGVFNNRIASWARTAIYEHVTIAMSALFVFFSVISLAVYFLKKKVDNIVKVPLFIKADNSKKKHGKKVQSFSECLKLMIESGFLHAMLLNSFGYYVQVNICEVSWKNGLKAGAEYKNEDKRSFVTSIMSKEQMFVGVAVIVVLLSPIVTVIDRCGWYMAALIPLITTAISSLVVLSTAYVNYARTGGTNIIFPSLFREGSPVFNFENYSGMVAVSLSKIMKYGVYDNAKEAISTLVDPVYRPILKAVYDGYGNRLAKSLGSVYGALVNSTGRIDIRSTAPISLLICGLLTVLWLRAIKYLARKYAQAIQTSSYIDIDLSSEKEKGSSGN